jgi:hypothetical protein
LSVDDTFLACVEDAKVAGIQPWTGHARTIGEVVMNGDIKAACVQGMGTPISQKSNPFQQ